MQFDPSRYVVPPGFTELLEGYVTEVIRFNPPNIVDFSRQYFSEMADGTLSESLAKRKAGLSYMTVQTRPGQEKYRDFDDEGHYLGPQVDNDESSTRDDESSTRDDQSSDAMQEEKVFIHPALRSQARQNRLSKPSQADRERRRSLGESRGSFKGLGRGAKLSDQATRRATLPAKSSARRPKPDANKRKSVIFKEAFSKYDRNNKGVIDMADLSTLLDDIGWVPNDENDLEETKQALAKLDKNGDGALELNEFLQWTEFAWQARVLRRHAEPANKKAFKKTKRRSTLKQLRSTQPALAIAEEN